MAVVILCLMDLTEPLMWWLLVKKHLFSVMEMLVKDVQLPWNPKMLLYMWQNVTLFVLYKLAWKDTEWLPKNRWLTKSIYLSLQLVIRILLWPLMWLKWKIMLLYAILDILTMKLIWLASPRFLEYKNKSLRIW